VISHASGDLSLLRQVTPNCPVIGAELIFAYDVEMATCLADVLLRRAMIGYAPDMGLAAAEALLTIGRDHLGWSADEANAELETYQSAIERFQPRVLKSG
jgi:glycerol-3-phosphate dehydrogenase